MSAPQPRAAFRLLRNHHLPGAPIDRSFRAKNMTGFTESTSCWVPLLSSSAGHEQLLDKQTARRFLATGC